MKTEILLFFLSISLISCPHSEYKLLEIETVLPQELTIQSEQRVTNAHIRGLFMVNDALAWASGTQGTYMKCTDGLTWKADSIPGYTHLDFRDVHAFDEKTALLMAAGEEGRILRTEDGGTTWREVYTNLEEGIFLDGMDFEGDLGYCIGDPMNGETFVLQSLDRGSSWKRFHLKNASRAIPNEGSYAASGTTVVVKDNSLKLVWSGDSLSRLVQLDGGRDPEIHPIPLRIGEGCGVFSMAFRSKDDGVAVGGCYLDSLSRKGNCVRTRDGGVTWVKGHVNSGPNGYRSCVAYAPKTGFYLTCGRTGIDVSYNQGMSWQVLSKEGYYTCSLADSTGWLMGRNGKMAKIKW
jgi:photosystem II stability/assembly factor-like uncharacterized protein